jgi:hypothetical protein
MSEDEATIIMTCHGSAPHLFAHRKHISRVTLTTQRPKKTSCGQNRFQMIGSWRKKLDFSTVLTVVDQVMLYPTKWDTRAADMGIDMPVKNIAKKATRGGQRPSANVVNGCQTYGSI